jgi:hypothetical protein
MLLRWVESNVSIFVLPNVGQTHPRTLLFWEGIFSIWEKDPRSCAVLLRPFSGRSRRKLIAFDGRICLAYTGKNAADLVRSARRARSSKYSSVRMAETFPRVVTGRKKTQARGSVYDGYEAFRIHGSHRQGCLCHV